MSPVKRTKAPAEAEVVASIRWFTNLIEMMALERYMGDRAQAPAIKIIFEETAKKLKLLKLGGDCPDDWEVCRDQKCEPSCLEKLLA
jgi:hypothetical protein